MGKPRSHFDGARGHALLQVLQRDFTAEAPDAQRIAVRSSAIAFVHAASRLMQLLVMQVLGTGEDDRNR